MHLYRCSDCGTYHSLERCTKCRSTLKKRLFEIVDNGTIETLIHVPTKTVYLKVEIPKDKEISSLTRSAYDMIEISSAFSHSDATAEVEELKQQVNGIITKRVQPCGCIVCVCEPNEENSCLGCGAKSCGDKNCDVRKGILVYEEHPLKKQRDKLLKACSEADDLLIGRNNGGDSDTRGCAIKILRNAIDGVESENT